MTEPKTKSDRPSSHLRDWVSGLIFRLSPETWLKRRLADERWHEIEVCYLPILVDPTRSAVDVGAHTGKYAYELSRLVPTVYALEPDRNLSNRLRRALPGNVRVHAVAASNNRGNARFVIPVINGRAECATASIEPLNDLGKDHRCIAEMVQTVPLDELINEPVGFIKIDVEGHELSVLGGALELLKKDRPTILIEAEERHRRGAVGEVRALMERLGYLGYFIYEKKLRAIGEFGLEMQQPSELERPVKRSEMRYVNNFIYAHCSRAPTIKNRLECALNQTSSS